MKRYYFTCVTHGNSIETDDAGVAQEWVCAHVSDWREHKIILTDRSHKDQPVSLDIKSEPQN